MSRRSGMPYLSIAMRSSPMPKAKPWYLSGSSPQDRKSTRLNSSHLGISYAVFCLKKKRQTRDVLMHFIYFHDATAWGIESVAHGGTPWCLPTAADTIKEAPGRLQAHETIARLLS